MSRINTNVLSLIAQRTLRIQNQGLGISLERLSTGLRINRGKDGPAALIASESLRSEKAAIGAAIRNGERAEQVVNVAEGGLQEINNLLIELQSLVAESANEAGISGDEKDANQLQIDSILQTIDRIANATSFNGLKLLNGNFDYTTSGVAAEFDDVTVNTAKLSETAGAFITVTVDVVTLGQTAGVFMSTAGTLVNNDDGSITIEVTGNKGVQQFTFASGTDQADIVTAINTFKESLGVSAAVSAADSDFVEFRSLKFGETQFAQVKILEGTADDLLTDDVADAPDTQDLKDLGRDATVLINGTQATTDGLKARVASEGLDLTVTIDGTGTLNDDGQTSSFYITGGGADFNLSPDVDLSGKVSIGIETVTTGNLGNAIDGYLSALKAGGSANVTNGDLTKAQAVVDSAVRQVSSLRGRLGSFQRNTVQSTINNLGVTLENITSAESQIRDTDFAKETADLTRQQILVQAASQVLAIANAQPQAVLQLLG